MTGPMKKQRPPSLIDGWLGPEVRLLERHELRVAAPPERAYEAIRQVRLAEMPIVRALFTVRRIPHSKEMTLQELIDHRHEREEQVLRLLAGGKTTPRAMLGAIYPELDRRIVPMALRQIEAHLAKLQDEGRAEPAAAPGEWRLA